MRCDTGCSCPTPSVNNWPHLLARPVMHVSAKGPCWSFRMDSLSSLSSRTCTVSSWKAWSRQMACAMSSCPLLLVGYWCFGLEGKLLSLCCLICLSAILRRVLRKVVVGIGKEWGFKGIMSLVTTLGFATWCIALVDDNSTLGSTLVRILSFPSILSGGGAGGAIVCWSVSAICLYALKISEPNLRLDGVLTSLLLNISIRSEATC